MLLLKTEKAFREKRNTACKESRGDNERRIEERDEKAEVKR